jgi:hypothetical protein
MYLTGLLKISNQHRLFPKTMGNFDREPASLPFPVPLRGEPVVEIICFSDYLYQRKLPEWALSAGLPDWEASTTESG